MSHTHLLKALLGAEKVQAVEDALLAVEKSIDYSYVPVGARENNRGAIDVASDPVRAFIERITNAHDAILELEHQAHNGNPMCRSPREAAEAWLGVPASTGLSGLTPRQRQELAKRTIVRLEPGEGAQSRILSVIDSGTGIERQELPLTILSLNASNKIQKHYLAGTYGQGGSSTFAFCKYTLIASRTHETSPASFTVIKYEELPPEEYKTGQYVYLIHQGLILQGDLDPSVLKHGTLIRHFGYDLSKYTSALGAKSLYGMLQRVLFDPVAPVWLEEKTKLSDSAKPRNRTIKGTRNALNGAVDPEDEASGPTKMSYSMPMFYAQLGDFGSVGYEYWVLAMQEEGKKSPASSYVDSARPVIMTHNGQNQDEISALFLKKDADLPFLSGRLIVHINCDRLASGAKRKLFASTREQAREGVVKARILAELLELLKADDELKRINAEARDHSLRQRDAEAEKQVQRQVSKLLGIFGSAPDTGGKTSGGSGDGPVSSRPPRPAPRPIDIQEPPTYIRILADEADKLRFYAGQRRYLRLETDASSEYHNDANPKQSRINVAIESTLKVIGSSPLRGGRMRVLVQADSDIEVGTIGSIRVELYRAGLAALSDEKVFEVVPVPQPVEKEPKQSLPQFEIIPVAGPEDENWPLVCDDSETNDVRDHASCALMNSGVLYVYYSTAYPKYSIEIRKLEQRDTNVAESFRRRYEIWLAVHALLAHSEKNEASNDLHENERLLRELGRQERCRVASVAVIMALQEVRSGVNTEDDE